MAHNDLTPNPTQLRQDTRSDGVHHPEIAPVAEPTQRARCGCCLSPAQPPSPRAMWQISCAQSGRATGPGAIDSRPMWGGKRAERRGHLRSWPRGPKVGDHPPAGRADNDLRDGECSEVREGSVAEGFDRQDDEVQADGYERDGAAKAPGFGMRPRVERPSDRAAIEQLPFGLLRRTDEAGAGLGAAVHGTHERRCEEGGRIADRGGDTAASLGLEIKRRDGARIDDPARDPLCLRHVGGLLGGAAPCGRARRPPCRSRRTRSARSRMGSRTASRGDDLESGDAREKHGDLDIGATRGVGDVVPCLPARSLSHTVVELHSVAISHLSGRDGQQYAVRWGDRQRRCNLSATPPGLPLPHPQKEETMATVEATRLQQVVYELLDAHDDTARLVAETADDDRWSAHLEYLRALQRRTRGILARSGEAGRS
jgi:hypothetical protein